METKKEKTTSVRKKLLSGDSSEDNGSTLKTQVSPSKNIQAPVNIKPLKKPEPMVGGTATNEI